MEFLKMFFGAFGGCATVIGATVLFAKKKIKYIIDKRIDYHFNTKLEKKKGIFEKKIYVSQHKFDKEFEIIQELMAKTFDFTYLTWNVYSTIGEINTGNNSLENFKKACDDFTLFYMKNCAFIPQDLAQPFDLFVKKINEFRSAAKGYSELQVKVLKRDYTSDKENRLFEKYEDTMKTIHNEINTDSNYSHSELVRLTRMHYEKLDIT